MTYDEKVRWLRRYQDSLHREQDWKAIFKHCAKRRVNLYYL